MQTNRYILAVFVGLLGLMVSASGLMAETPDERAARIKAAQDALKQAQEDEESPEALKARVVELEAENRKLRTKLARLEKALASAGILLDADDHNANLAGATKRPIRVSNFERFVSSIPEDAFPPKGQRNDRGGWTPAHAKAIGDWLRENQSKIDFNNFSIRLISGPTPVSFSGPDVNDDDNWYTVSGTAQFKGSQSRNSGGARFIHNGILWNVNFQVLLNANSESRLRRIRSMKGDLLNGDTISIDATIGNIGNKGILYKPSEVNIYTRANSQPMGNNRHIGFVAIRTSLIATDFK